MANPLNHAAILLTMIFLVQQNHKKMKPIPRQNFNLGIHESSAFIELLQNSVTNRTKYYVEASYKNIDLVNQK